MFNRAPVALRWTRMSLDLASLVKGPRAPDRAIFALLSSCVAKLVMQPTALHWTSTLAEFICRMRGMRPPKETMRTLLSAARMSESPKFHNDVKTFHTVDREVSKCSTCCPLHFNILTL